MKRIKEMLNLVYIFPHHTVTFFDETGFPPNNVADRPAKQRGGQAHL